MRHGGGVVMAVALATGVMMFGPRLQSSQAAPAQVIQYQGRLTDLNGVPLEGQVHELRFKIYSSATPSPATFVWGERHRNVAVNRGVFTVHLGSGLEAIDVNDAPAGPAQGFTSQFDGNARFIQVTVLRTAGDTPEQLTPLNQVGSVPFAIQAGGSVPIGAIVDWYRPSPTLRVPAGWALCDGNNVNDTESPLHGLPTPNLTGRFTRGLNPSAAYNASGDPLPGYGAGTPTPLPESGGAAALNLGHAHGGGFHSHGMGSHTHSMNHTHTGDSLVAGNVINRVIFAAPPGTTPTHRTDALAGAENHNHQISGTTSGPSTNDTGPPNGGGSTDGSGIQTDTQLGTFDNQPPFVGMLKIIRIR